MLPRYLFLIESLSFWVTSLVLISISTRFELMYPLLLYPPRMNILLSDTAAWVWVVRR